MKKLLCVLCTLAMLLTAFGAFSVGAIGEPVVPAGVSKWDGTIPAADKTYAFEGSGTEADPWLIQSADEFALFAANVRLNDQETCYAGKYFKLTVDIDMANHEWWGIGGARVGTDAGLSTSASDSFHFSYFSGIFDGDCHKIYNFALAASTEVINEESGKPETLPLQHQGLFGMVVGATIKNLGIESGKVELDVNSNRSGVFVGVGRFGFLIENCYNKADAVITCTMSNAIVGTFMGIAIDKWSATTNPEASTADTQQGKSFINCYNTGNLTVNLKSTSTSNKFRIGGIVGQVVTDASSMNGVWNLGDITVNYNGAASTQADRRLGGIAGALLDKNLSYSNLYYKGTIQLVTTDSNAFTNNFLSMMVGNLSTGTGVAYDSWGYCVGEGTTEAIAARVAGGHSTTDWCEEMDDITIPLAADSTFIEDTRTPANVVYYGHQMAAGQDSFDLRFITEIQDITAYSKLGIKLEISYMEGSTLVKLKTDKSSTTVCQSLLEMGGTSVEQAITPDAGYAYFLALTLEDIPANLGEVTFTVTPYAVEAEGGAIVTFETAQIQYNNATFVK